MKELTAPARTGAMSAERLLGEADRLLGEVAGITGPP